MSPSAFAASSIALRTHAASWRSQQYDCGLLTVLFLDCRSTARFALKGAVGPGADGTRSYAAVYITQQRPDHDRDL